MTTHRVNLDALIPREDMEVVIDSPQTAELSQTIKIGELEKGSWLLPTLRKPDFQRETNSWDPSRVVRFIQSFVEGDLIPALILWPSDSSRNNFVIDGAHRLSALIAWVHDDYGDKNFSQKFFSNRIPREQQIAADQTRKAINDSIGAYSRLQQAVSNEETSPKEMVLRGKSLSFQSIRVQWVPGDAKRAEKSYFTINEQQAPIGDTEKRMIEDRRKPNAIATRAIIRAGTGHKYWRVFPRDETRTEVERLAREIYEILHTPDLETPIKTLDLPVAGRGYSADSVRQMYDFVVFANRHRRQLLSGAAGKRNNKLVEVPDDSDGAETTEYLKNVRRVVGRIAGNQPPSLGLHPAVYFYSATGRYQPTAFLATVSFIDDLIKRDKLVAFTENRYNFEEFLLRYKFFINQVVQRRGSDNRSLAPLTKLIEVIFDGITQNLSDEQIFENLKQHSNLSFLNNTQDFAIRGREFTTETKSAAFLREALESAIRCDICQARVHKNSMQLDHVINLQEGGGGDLENAQVAHPYCNTGYKEYLRAKG